MLVTGPLDKTTMEDTRTYHQSLRYKLMRRIKSVYDLVVVSIWLSSSLFSKLHFKILLPGEVNAGNDFFQLGGEIKMKTFCLCKFNHCRENNGKPSREMAMAFFKECLCVCTNKCHPYIILMKEVKIWFWYKSKWIGMENKKLTSTDLEGPGSPLFHFPLNSP